jgi:aryl sulfotransferase
MTKEVPVRYRMIISDSARWEGFEPRPDDIIISTPPKCGTTWMQMICALLIFQSPTFDRPLDLISPWLDMQTRDRDSVIADLTAQQHRRFIKSHTPLDGLPDDDSITYICVARDPRDVARSWDNHVANTDLGALMTARQTAVGLDDLAEVMGDSPPAFFETEVERFWAWVDEPTPPTMNIASLRGTVHHLASFWDVRDRPNVILVRYQDLKRDLAGEMRRIAVRLGIDVPEERWSALVEAATFERMRERAADVAPDVTHHIWHDDTNFFHRGTSGQWRELLDEAGLERYRAAVTPLASPELLAWIHDGGLP